MRISDWSSDVCSSDLGFVASTLYSGVPSLVRELRKHAPELDIQLLEMMSSQQIEALKTGRIDIGFGRIRRNDPAAERTVLREERLEIGRASCRERVCPYV